MEYEYKVIDVADGSINSLLLDKGRIETNLLEAYINAVASEGWRMVFMAKGLQRHLVNTDHETLMITFERRIPELDQEARAARCVDDFIAAEQSARSKGYAAAAAGAAALAVGGAVIAAIPPPAQTLVPAPQHQEHQPQPTAPALLRCH
jgi:hypothetical protein